MRAFSDDGSILVRFLSDQPELTALADQPSKHVSTQAKYVRSMRSLLCD